LERILKVSQAVLLLQLLEHVGDFDASTRFEELFDVFTAFPRPVSQYNVYELFFELSNSLLDHA